MHDVKMKICQRDSKKDDMTDNVNNDNNDSLFVAHDLNAIVGPKTDGRGAPFDRVVVLKNNIDDDLVDDHDHHDLVMRMTTMMMAAMMMMPLTC